LRTSLRRGTLIVRIVTRKTPDLNQAGFSNDLLPYYILFMRCRSIWGNGLRRNHRSSRGAMGQNHCHIGRDACVRNRRAKTPKCFEPLHLIADPSSNGSVRGVRAAACPATLSECPSFRRPWEYGYSDTRTKPALKHAHPFGEGLHRRSPTQSSQGRPS
jgi:hypothetical protein